MTSRIEGIGIGLRRPHARPLLTTERRLDWLEVTPENWVCHGGERARLFHACAERWPMVSHSVSLSIGGPDPLDETLLGAIDQLSKKVGAPWWSDHLCYSTVEGSHLHDLLPLPASAQAVKHAAHRIRAAQRRVDAEFVLENISFYAHMPGGEMEEVDFLRAVLEEADCGLLLDVNNVYVNSLNHGFDARAYLDRMPFDRVRQLHLAGHTPMDGVVIDTHIGPISDEVWSLYRHTLRRAGRMIPTLIEWDQDIPVLDVLLDEADRARAHAEAALAELAPAQVAR